MNLKGFLSENVSKGEELRRVISTRFKDEDGKPIEWVFQPVTAEEDERLKEQSVKQDVDKKTGKPKVKSDGFGYARRLTVASIKEPDLYNASLQDSYGVKTPEELIITMLYSGEYNLAQSTAQEVNNFNTYAELEEEAKNE